MNQELLNAYNKIERLEKVLQRILDGSITGSWVYEEAREALSEVADKVAER